MLEPRPNPAPVKMSEYITSLDVILRKHSSDLNFSAEGCGALIKDNFSLLPAASYKETIALLKELKDLRLLASEAIPERRAVFELLPSVPGNPILLRVAVVDSPQRLHEIYGVDSVPLGRKIVLSLHGGCRGGGNRSYQYVLYIKNLLRLFERKNIECAVPLCFINGKRRLLT